MLFHNRFFKNVLPLIVGNFLLALITLVFFIPIIIILIATADDFNLVSALSFVGVTGLMIVGLLFYIPFYNSALFHSIHQILVERKNIKIGDMFRNGKKTYTRYLGFFWLAILVSIAIQLVLELPLIIIAFFSEALALILFIIFFIPLLAIYTLESIAMFKVEMSESAVQGAIFPITAWAKFKETFILFLIILGTSILFGIFVLITFGIGAIFHPYYIMFLYEQYLKRYHPDLLNDLYEAEKTN